MSHESDPGKFAAVVVASDVTVLGPTRELWIGVAGNLTLKMAGDGAIVQFLNVPVGLFRIQCTQVRAATTAGSIVAVW
jgi:hypothetical protein